SPYGKANGIVLPTRAQLSPNKVPETALYSLPKNQRDSGDLTNHRHYRAKFPLLCRPLPLSLRERG
ncbi:MAG: hypothetical protein KF726_18535, partial [Anaerolineae bacterium]|nr:hypothetical protein [Anaerolineae bacterium]